MSLKQLAYRSVDLVGANALVGASGWRRRRLLVLCYHGISKHDEHVWSDLYASSSHLDSRLSWLRAKGYSILPLGEALHALYAGQLPPRAVSVTFDDGFHDFSLLAMPVLERHQVPTTLYLTTHYVGQQVPVFDPALSYVLWKGAGGTFRVPWNKDLIVVPSADNRAARDRLHGELRTASNSLGLTTEEKQQLLVGIGEQLRVDMARLMTDRLFFLMNDREVRSLDRSLVDVQLHTHRHRVPDDAAAFDREIVDNARAITAITGRNAFDHFCYPSGAYSPLALQRLPSLGISWATTCEHGLASRSTHPLLIPRLLDSNHISEAAFSAWAHGTIPLLKGSRHSDEQNA